jgi:hypothetical protein
MNCKRFPLAIAASLLITPSGMVAQAPRCSIEGSWINGWVDASGSAVESDTLVPLDPAGARLAFRGTITNPSIWTPFAPNAAVLGTIVGTFVRTGSTAYKFTMIMHAAEALAPGTPGRARITSLAVLSGTAECADENTLVQKGTFAMFSAIDVPAMGIHNQDKDHDGFPDVGEMPIVSVPVELISRRVQVQEPYPATP